LTDVRELTNYLSEMTTVFRTMIEIQHTYERTMKDEVMILMMYINDKMKNSMDERCDDAQHTVVHTHTINSRIVPALIIT